MNDGYVKRFIEGYKECALWSSQHCDHGPACGGNADVPFDEVDAEWSAKAEKRIYDDCLAFCWFQRRDLAASGQSPEQAGHDFWLTRNGHGAGFWDGDWPEGMGKRLTDASKAFPEQYLYLGDDGIGID